MIMMINTLIFLHESRIIYFGRYFESNKKIANGSLAGKIAGRENTKSTKDKRESCGCQSFNSPQNTKKIIRVKT